MAITPSAWTSLPRPGLTFKDLSIIKPMKWWRRKRMPRQHAYRAVALLEASLAPENGLFVQLKAFLKRTSGGGFSLSRSQEDSINMSSSQGAMSAIAWPCPIGRCLRLESDHGCLDSAGAVTKWVFRKKKQSFSWWTPPRVRGQAGGVLDEAGRFSALPPPGLRTVAGGFEFKRPH